MNRDQIVSKAREYIDTPFKHQGRLKNIGVDCAGLIVCVAKELGITVNDHQSYERQPDVKLMTKKLDENLVRKSVSELIPGDVLYMRFSKEPQHLAIVSDKGIIHAYEKQGRVVEHRLNDVWKAKIVRVYEFKGLN